MNISLRSRVQTASVVVVTIALSACSAIAPVAELPVVPVKASVSAIAPARIDGMQQVTGVIENDGPDAVTTVVVRLGGYDSQGYRTQTLNVTAGPLPGHGQERFTASCRAPCDQVKVESVDAL